ncbi:2-polyprenyl-3-methyl-5-hydroxy-6-metoxy-1,4-benzoquinol methylase [Fusobacterium sp. PH5-7]|nr:2-polyprenyl-3-methyl-5-hydroxy-6-metoxy-1,4-benzoquinol methylase [Fusobacterium sp. PH5-7]
MNYFIFILFEERKLYMKKQVDKNYYLNFFQYVNKDTWNSYYQQIEEALKSKSSSVLIIGMGDGIVPKILRNYIKEVKTFDIAEDLEPDYIGNILDINEIIDKKYECIICCEVLEHLPFDKFEKCIEKLEKITAKKCIISLPQQYIRAWISFKIPKLPLFNLIISLPKNYMKYKFNGEHYWELGTKGYSVVKIRKILKKYFNIENEYTPLENKYHRFFILKKGKNND